MPGTQGSEIIGSEAQGARAGAGPQTRTPPSQRFLPPLHLPDSISRSKSWSSWVSWQRTRQWVGGRKRPPRDHLSTDLPPHPLAWHLLSLVPVFLSLAFSLDWKGPHYRDPFEKCIQDPDYEQLLKVMTLGLNRTTKPQRVIVVGAGLAGLVTAKMLGDAGHKVRGPAVPWCKGGRWAGAGAGGYLFPCLGLRDTPHQAPRGTSRA